MLHKSKIALLKYGLPALLLMAMLIFSSANEIENYTERIKDISLNSISDQDETYPMEKVQVLPQFPGKAAGWGKFMEVYNYPLQARNNKIQGTFYLTFIIEKDGSLTDIKILRDLGFGTGEEAVRLLKTSPKWAPGVQAGQPVRVAYTQPIKLSLDNNVPKPAASVTKNSNGLVSGPVLAPEFPGGPQTHGLRDMEGVTPAKFPGGAQAYADFLKGYKYPEEAKNNNISGIIRLHFVVEADGSLTNFSIVPGISAGINRATGVTNKDVSGFGTGEEAIRLIKTSPKWIPATLNGVNTRMGVSMRIKVGEN